MDASALKWRQLFGSLLPPMRVAYYGGVVSITTYMDTALWQLLKNDFFQALPKLPLPPLPQCGQVVQLFLDVKNDVLQKQLTMITTMIRVIIVIIILVLLMILVLKMTKKLHDIDVKK